jgi:putative tryptophan/tyrosine transport system substrate-binding protein
MWYRIFGCLVTLAILVAPLATDAQPTGHSRRIGWLRPAGRPSGAAFEAFLHSLRDMGYVEGQNLIIKLRQGEGKTALLPTLAAELVRLPVEVIVTSGTPATLAAREATSTIPIVFAGVADPVDQGLIASWARPGGNITGAASSSVEFNTGKQLELLKEVVPTTARVAVLVTPGHPLYAAALQELQAWARLLRMDLHLMDVRDPATDLERAFAALAHERVDALCMLGDPAFTPYRTRIVELVAASRLPATYGSRGFVEAGGLMSYTQDSAAMARRAGVMVGKILRGTKPADIPAEFPMQFELTINLKTAKALGLTIPQHILALADRVIQ